MLSENEKRARQAFFLKNGKTPEQEGAASTKGLSYMLTACGVVAGLSILFYLTH